MVNHSIGLTTINEDFTDKSLRTFNDITRHHCTALTPWGLDLALILADDSVNDVYALAVMFLLAILTGKLAFVLGRIVQPAAMFVCVWHFDFLLFPRPYDYYISQASDSPARPLARCPAKIRSVALLRPHWNR
jgi:K+-sensing histidine kinase KdpD